MEILLRKHSLKNTIRKCQICQRKFKPTRKEYLHCSVKCGAIASRIRKGQYLIIKCDTCGKEFHSDKSQFERQEKHFCSRKCYAMYQTKSELKEKNPNWRGGVRLAKTTVSSSRKFGAKGRRYERKTRKLLEKEGFYVMRSAGSLGKFDLIAFNQEKFRLIQVKSGTSRIGKKEREEIKEFPVPLNCSKELWRWLPQKKPIITILQGSAKEN